MKHIFVSYHHSDRKFAEILINKIKEAGFETWIDNDQLHHDPGVEWRTAIDQAIENAFALIVIMTPEAKASDYVTYEWAYAWGARVKVIPVLYKETKLHPRLEALQHLKFTNPRSRHWDTLIKAVKKAASTPSTQQIDTDTIAYPPPPEEDVEIIRKEIVYEYLSDGKSIFQRKHLMMKMLKNGISTYQDRYRWTGKGKCIVKLLTAGFKITNQHKGDDGIWNYFDITFPYPIHESDMIEFTIEWELVDEEGMAIAFLSTMIDRETKYLLLQVNLPLELKPERAYFHEYANFADTLPSDTKKIDWSPATKSISYEVTKPQKKHKYMIRWYYQ